jgi:hypothetical protein
LLRALPTSTRNYQRAPASAENGSNEKPGLNEKSGTVVTEKEIKGGKGTKGKGDPAILKPPVKEAMPLHRPSTISQLIAWTIMMILPIFYVGK